MSTAFATLRDTLAAAFLQAPALADGRVTSGLKVALVNQAPTRVDVQLVDSKEQLDLVGIGAPRTWVTTLAVTCLARASAGDTPDDDLDALVLAVEQRLAGVDLAPLGVIAIAPDSRIQWAIVDGTPPQAMAQRLVRITHQTAGATLAPRA